MMLLPAAGAFMNDLHVYDPVSRAWTDLSSSVIGIPPTPRDRHGFASAIGNLFVHGGAIDSGPDLRALDSDSLSS